MISDKQKTVIVVAPEKYSSSARRLVHEISKNSDFEAVVWTPSVYKENEPQLTGDNSVIFIGNSNENPFTESYLKCIKELKEARGAIYGYDGSKAVIFSGASVRNSRNIAQWILYLALLPPICFVETFCISSDDDDIHFSNKELYTEQINSGIDYFLDNVFEEWLDFKSSVA